MVSLTININDDEFKSIESFSWVSWSELVRLELRKKLIFEKYIKNKTVSTEDSKFCDEIDWHPVDELPIKKSFVVSLKKQSKYVKVGNKELNKLLGL